MSGRAARKKKLVRTRPVSESDSSGPEIADVGAGSEGPALPRIGPWDAACQGMGEAARWQRAAVRAVDLKAGQISSASGTSWVGPAPGGGNTKVPSRAKLDASFQENHKSAVGQSGSQPAHKSGFPFPGFLGNGTRRVSVGEAHVTAVVGSEGEGSPPPPPPPDWSDPPDNHGEGGTLADTDSESIPSSTHSSVLVDMGKVVGVLRTYTSSQAADRALLEPADSNGADEDCVSDDDDDDDEGSVTGGRAEVCATCAQEARGLEDSELDSLCGDPLVYATFVAPVHQYSTETEPSRQPSVKQNSSETEGCPPPASSAQVGSVTCWQATMQRVWLVVFRFICSFGGFMIRPCAHPILSWSKDKEAVC